MLKHMRQKQLLSLALTASVGAAIILSGCSAEPILPSKAEEYSREFIKNFGVFDRTHDWNHATRTTVDITTTSPTDVKIYADVDGSRYLFGTYLKVNGQKTLDVDIPKGVTDLVVRANGQNYAVKAGGTVDFKTLAPSMSRGSRTISEGTRTTGSIKMTFGKTDDYKYFPPRAIRDFLDRVPEGGHNMSKVIPNFYFTSFKDESVTLYPLYWNTSSSHILGVFWLDDDGNFNWVDCNDNIEERRERHVSFEQMQDLYWTRSGELTYCKSNNSNDVYIQDGVFNSEAFNTYYSMPEREFTTLGNGNESLSAETSTGALRSKGVTVKFNKDGVRFGFYIKVGINDNQPLLGDNFTFDKYNNLTYTVNSTGIKSYNHVMFSNASRNKEYGKITDKVGSDIYMYILGANEWDGWRLADSEDKIPFDHPDFASWFGPSNPNNRKNYRGVASDYWLYNFINFNFEINNTPWPDTETDGTTATDEEDLEALKYVQAAFLEIPAEESYDGHTRRYFAFEDWKNGACDLNDLIFVLESTKVKVTDEEKDDDKIIEDDPEPDPVEWEWIIACEDLGTNDFDFNDVVFSVSGAVTDAQTDTKTVKVKALAAGGTLPVYLWYKDRQLHPDGQDDAEFHAWFEGNHSSSTVINASGVRATGKTATVEVDGDFTMSCCMTAEGSGESGNMGGFKVEVKHSDGGHIISATNPNIESQIGEAPQMICVPATWRWPRENVHIRTVYPDFIRWCENGHDATIDWHNNRNGNGYFL